MITRIEAFRYRCFDHLDIQLGSYHVLAGTNGSGKSTLLDILILLGDILKRGTTYAFLEDPSPIGGGSRAQSLQELIHCRRGDYFGFAVEVEIPENIVTILVDRYPSSVKVDPKRWHEKLRYEVRFQVFNQVELHVTDEFLNFVSPTAKEPETGWGIGGERPSRSWVNIINRERGGPAAIKAEFERGNFDLRLNPQQLALANIPMDSHLFPATVYLRKLLEAEVIRYEPSWSILRGACPPGQPKRIRTDAANLPWLALWLKQENPEMFLRWVEHVHEALPNVANIEAVEREEDHHAYFKVSYKGGYDVTSSGLSDGTLRILALTILPYLDYAPPVICLEEPENGIHPKAIQRVIESLTSMYDSQVWLSTHSPIVLANSNLEQVIIMRVNDEGKVVAIPGDKNERLKDWQGSLDLGSLFVAGVLG